MLSSLEHSYVLTKTALNIKIFQTGFIILMLEIDYTVQKTVLLMSFFPKSKRLNNLSPKVNTCDEINKKMCSLPSISIRVCVYMYIFFVCLFTINSSYFSFK